MPTDSASHYAADDPSITSTQTGSANRPKPAAAPTATSPLSSASPTKQSAATAGTSASPPAAAGSTASNSSATRTCPATSAARSSAHGTAGNDYAASSRSPPTPASTPPPPRSACSNRTCSSTLTGPTSVNYFTSSTARHGPLTTCGPRQVDSQPGRVHFAGPIRWVAPGPAPPQPSKPLIASAKSYRCGRAVCQYGGRERSAARLRSLSRLHPVTAYWMIVAVATVSDMDRRIFGLETEYGVTCTYRGQRRLSPDEVARYLFRRVVSWGRSSNVFLRNGARLYLDVGSHPEYATPECDSVNDLVVHDRAGERILEGLLVDAEKRLYDEGIAGEIYLFKNNTDSAGNSYGCHENYLVSRHGEFGRLADILIPFLVTRQLICGAGKVLQTPRGAVYCLSQRAEHIWEGVSSATTRSRPIINTRDEPHADAERYRRLHVIVGDSNMNEVTTLLKVGSADIVL